MSGCPVRVEVPLARLCLNPRTRIDHHPLLFCLARALLVLPRRGRAENGLILFSCCLLAGPGPGPVACAVNPDYSCVIYRPWVCVFVRAIRYQLEDTGSVKLKSTRDPPAPRGPRRRTLVTSALMRTGTFFSRSPRVCPPLNGQAHCRSRSDSGSGAARRVRR